MLTADRWIRDLPQQFQEKENIEILIKALAMQMDEVEAVLEDVNALTNLETANGINLDYVGDILNLSRKAATEIVRKAESVSLPDELYRKILRYQKLKTSSECTYEDILAAISAVWNADNVTYVEDPARPATVLLKLPDTSLDSDDPAIGRILSIKAAGVAVYYSVNYLEEISQRELEKMYFPLMEITSKFQFWSGLYLDGSWLLDGKNKLTGIAVPMLVNISHGAVTAKTENVVASEVVLKKNLWYLDGAELLDGSRLLNASITKEVL